MQLTENLVFNFAESTASQQNIDAVFATKPQSFTFSLRTSCFKKITRKFSIYRNVEVDQITISNWRLNVDARRCFLKTVFLFFHHIKMFLVARSGIMIQKITTKLFQNDPWCTWRGIREVCQESE